MIRRAVRRLMRIDAIAAGLGLAFLLGLALLQAWFLHPDWQPLVELMR